MNEDSNLSSQHNLHQRIVFFDGVCALCNRFVDFLITRDKKHKLFFAPLQGSTAKILLPEYEFDHMSTFVYLRNGKKFYRSDAALLLFTDIRGLWKLLLVFWIVPRLFRDAVYNFVSRNRYKWFGRKESCRLPRPGEKEFFLH